MGESLFYPSKYGHFEGNVSFWGTKAIFGDIWVFFWLWLGPQEATLSPICKDHSGKPFQGASIWLWNHVVEGICWSRPRGPFVRCGWFGRIFSFRGCVSKLSTSRGEQGWLLVHQAPNGFVWKQSTFNWNDLCLYWWTFGGYTQISDKGTWLFAAAGFACRQHLRKERRNSSGAWKEIHSLHFDLCWLHLADFEHWRHDDFQRFQHSTHHSTHHLMHLCLTKKKTRHGLITRTDAMAKSQKSRGRTGLAGV